MLDPLDGDGDARGDGRQQRMIPRTRFEDGFAAGWVFGVSAAFKDALDIKPTPRILSARSPLLRDLARLGVVVSPDAIAGDAHALAVLAKDMRGAGVAVADVSVTRDAKGTARVVLTLETEGRPPLFSFAKGDVMHDPPMTHRLAWGEALPVLRRSVQVDEATPARAAEGPDNEGDPGEVRASVRRYSGGKLVAAEALVCSQSEFVRLLRDGVESGARTAREGARPPRRRPSTRTPEGPAQGTLL